jgi:hypothetical protein
VLQRRRRGEIGRRRQLAMRESAAEISQPSFSPSPGDAFARRMGVKAPYVASLEAGTRTLWAGSPTSLTR